MPSDLSSPRLGERALKLLGDMNKWGLKKRLPGEVDVFQIDSTHELYSHLNANCVRILELPKYDDYDSILQAVARGDYFISTGEILLPQWSIAPASPNEIVVRASVSYTFPLKMAEVVWGDGSETFRRIFPFDTTHELGKTSLVFSSRQQTPNGSQRELESRQRTAAYLEWTVSFLGEAETLCKYSSLLRPSRTSRTQTQRKR